MPHVTHSEASKGRELLESLDAHGLGWHKLDDGSVARLDRLGILLGGLAGTTVAFLLDLGELAGNVGRVAIQHGRVAVGDLAGVVQHNNLHTTRNCITQAASVSVFPSSK